METSLRFKKWRPDQKRDARGRWMDEGHEKLPTFSNFKLRSRRYQGTWIDQLAGGRPEPAGTPKNLRFHTSVKATVTQHKTNPYHRHQWLNIAGSTAVVQKTEGMNVTVRHVRSQRLETFHVNSKEAHKRPLPPKKIREQHGIGIDGKVYGKRGLPEIPPAIDDVNEIMTIVHDATEMRGLTRPTPAKDAAAVAADAKHEGRRLRRRVVPKLHFRKR